MIHRVLSVVAILSLLAGTAFATNGDNLMSIGPISRAMGGVGVAAPQIGVGVRAFCLDVSEHRLVREVEDADAHGLLQAALHRDLGLAQLEVGAHGLARHFPADGGHGAAGEGEQDQIAHAGSVVGSAYSVKPHPVTRSTKAASASRAACFFCAASALPRRRLSALQIAARSPAGKVVHSRR